MRPECDTFTTRANLPPSGRVGGGRVRFYGWAPDGDGTGPRQRLSVHIRGGRGPNTDDLLPVYFDSHEAAKAWVEEKNMAAVR